MSILRFWSRCAPATLLVPSLCGCGGDGGASVALTPPSPVYATLASGTGPLGGTGVVLNSSRAANASSPTYTTAARDVTISYNASTQTYTLSALTTPGSAQTVTASYGPAQVQAGIPGFYEATSSLNGVTTVSRLQLNQTMDLTYSDIGTWMTGATQADGSQNFNSTYFSYGVRTLASDMPKTGSASYALGLVGGNGATLVGGNGTLSANFADSTVALSLSPHYVYAQGTSPLGTLTGTGTISSSASTFAGTVGSTLYTGSVAGQFYGPQAAEAGGSFIINSASGGAVVAAGAFAGKRN